MEREDEKLYDLEMEKRERRRTGIDEKVKESFIWIFIIVAMMFKS